jgi:hypothetical protein
VLLPLNSLEADILRDLRRHGDLRDHCWRLGSRPKSSRRCGGRLRRLASFLDRLGLLLRLARLASFSPWKVIVISRFHLRFVGLHVEDESLRLFDGDVEGLATSAKRRDAVVCTCPVHVSIA